MTSEHNTYYQTHDGHSDLFESRTNDPETGLSVQIIVGDSRQLIQKMPDDRFDVIFHDAFSPRKQPELWTTQLFQQYRRVLAKENGVVITYSAAAPVRKAMHDAGFNVYTIPSLQKKTGTIACTRESDQYFALSPLEAGLIHCKSGIPYEDNVDLSLTPQEVMALRENKYQASTLINSSAVHRQFGNLKNLPESPTTIQ